MKGYRSHPNPALTSWKLPGDVEQAGLYYRFMRRIAHLMAVTVWSGRAYNRHHEPATGGVLYMANHQSYYDPIMVCGPLQRPGHFMARDSLFRNKYFAKLIDSVHAFPVKRGEGDVGALKESIRRLKANKTLLVFPEGTRTTDGRIGKFLPGSAMLSMKAATWTVPVLIDGAFEAWPKGSVVPRLGSRVVVQYGKPIHRDEARKYSAVDFVELVRKQMIEMQTELHKHLGKPALHYDE